MSAIRLVSPDGAEVDCSAAEYAEIDEKANLRIVPEWDRGARRGSAMVFLTSASDEFVEGGESCAAPSFQKFGLWSKILRAV